MSLDQMRPRCFNWNTQKWLGAIQKMFTYRNLAKFWTFQVGFKWLSWFSFKSLQKLGIQHWTQIAKIERCQKNYTSFTKHCTQINEPTQLFTRYHWKDEIHKSFIWYLVFRNLSTGVLEVNSWKSGLIWARLKCWSLSFVLYSLAYILCT